MRVMSWWLLPMLLMLLMLLLTEDLALPMLGSCGLESLIRENGGLDTLKI